MVKFNEWEWLGNKWSSIETTAIESGCGIRILQYLADTYNFVMPELDYIWALDEVYADFEILGSTASLHHDVWGFSIGFADTIVRDKVLVNLRALPEDYFC